jgi:hypothetical protein
MRRRPAGVTLNAMPEDRQLSPVERDLSRNVQVEPIEDSPRR